MNLSLVSRNIIKFRCFRLLYTIIVSLLHFYSFSSIYFVKIATITTNSPPIVITEFYANSLHQFLCSQIFFWTNNLFLLLPILTCSTRIYSLAARKLRTERVQNSTPNTRPRREIPSKYSNPREEIRKLKFEEPYRNSILLFPSLVHQCIEEGIYTARNSSKHWPSRCSESKGITAAHHRRRSSNYRVQPYRLAGPSKPRSIFISIQWYIFAVDERERERSDRSARGHPRCSRMFARSGSCETSGSCPRKEGEKGRGGFSSRATLSRKIYRRTVGFVATCMGSLLKGSGILKGFWRLQENLEVVRGDD